MFGRSAETAYVGDPEINDLERRAADLIRVGKVVEADYSRQPYVVRVGIGDEDEPDYYITTGWLPVMAGRSDEWNPLRTGEAVTVLSENGELQNGVVMPGSIHNSDNPSPGDRVDLFRKRFSDGSVIEYDEGAGALKFTSQTKVDLIVGDASIHMENGSIILSAGGQTFTLAGSGAESSGKIKGNSGLEVTGGPFTHNGKNVGETHRHLASGGPSIGGVPQ